mmetsp:Transcript_33300/g.79585  ORF Transcript_33300/g.79585 Transcript_33300/m.79585 type:complete len:225 (+) Transcript_33300:1774-2448(+)
MIFPAFVFVLSTILGNAHAQATWNPGHTFLVTTEADGTANVTVDWRVTSYDDVTVRIGSVVEFVYAPYHDVYVHPTGDCSTDGRVFVSDEEDEWGAYTFDEEGTVTFACDVADGAHCRAGQIVNFNVLPADDHDHEGDHSDAGHSDANAKVAEEEGRDHKEDDHDHSDAGLTGDADTDTKASEEEDASQEEVSAPAETISEESGAAMFSEIHFAAALSAIMAMM